MLPQNEINLQPVLDMLLEPFRQIRPDPTCIYSRNHLWLKQVHSHLWRIGLDLFAVQVLGQITEIIFSRYSALQAIGARLLWINQMDGMVAVQTPVRAIIKNINPEVRTNPALILADPFVKGWLLEGEFYIEQDQIFILPKHSVEAWWQQEVEWLAQYVRMQLQRRATMSVGETLTDGGGYITNIYSALGPVCHQDLLKKVMNL